MRRKWTVLCHGRAVKQSLISIWPTIVQLLTFVTLCWLGFGRENKLCSIINRKWFWDTSGQTYTVGRLHQVTCVKYQHLTITVPLFWDYVEKYSWVTPFGFRMQTPSPILSSSRNFLLSCYETLRLHISLQIKLKWSVFWSSCFGFFCFKLLCSLSFAHPKWSHVGLDRQRLKIEWAHLSE